LTKAKQELSSDGVDLRAIVQRARLGSAGDSLAKEVDPRARLPQERVERRPSSIVESDRTRRKKAHR
jgi:hypothetical protein